MEASSQEKKRVQWQVRRNNTKLVWSLNEMILMQESQITQTSLWKDKSEQWEKRTDGEKKELGNPEEEEAMWAKVSLRCELIFH